MAAEVPTSSALPAVPPGSVTVYNVLRPAPKGEIDHIVIYGHSSLFYWWPVWLACFVLAGVTYAEGEFAGGVTVSNTNVLGVIFVISPCSQSHFPVPSFSAGWCRWSRPWS